MSLVAKLNPLTWIKSKTNPSPLTSGGWEFFGQIMGALNGMWQSSSTVWRQLTRAEMEFKYQQHVVVYACVRFICLALQEAPMRVGRKVKGGWEDVTNHPAEFLLDQPNPEMHAAEYIWHVGSHLLLTGETYIWKWRNGAGEVTELWPIPSSWVTAVREPRTLRLIRYDVYQGNAKPVPVDPKDMIRGILPNPADLTSGLGPLQAAQRDVQTDDERTDYFVEMVANNREPGTVIYTPKQSLSEPEKENMRATFMQRFGKGNRGRPMILSGENAKIEKMPHLEDLDWPGLANLSETRICAAFGVSPILINLRSGHEAATLANFGQAKRATYETSVKPLWGLLDRMHSKGLITDETQGARPKEQIYSDLKEVAPLHEDANEKSDRAIKEFKAGLRKRNEAREAIGLEKVSDEMDGFLTSMGEELSNAPVAAPTATPDDGSAQEL